MDWIYVALFLFFIAAFAFAVLYALGKSMDNEMEKDRLKKINQNQEEEITQLKEEINRLREEVSDLKNQEDRVPEKFDPKLAELHQKVDQKAALNYMAETLKWPTLDNQVGVQETPPDTKFGKVAPKPRKEKRRNQLPSQGASSIHYTQAQREELLASAVDQSQYDTVPMSLDSFQVDVSPPVQNNTRCDTSQETSSLIPSFSSSSDCSSRSSYSSGSDSSSSSSSYSSSSDSSSSYSSDSSSSSSDTSSW